MRHLNPESGWRHGDPRKREQHVGGHRLRHPNLFAAPVPKAPDEQGEGRLKETRSRKQQERTDLGAHATLSSCSAAYRGASACSGAGQNEIVVIPFSKSDLIVLGIDASADGRRFAKIERRVLNTVKLPRGD
jgi:hypothetical protein